MSNLIKMSDVDEAWVHFFYENDLNLLQTQYGKN